jgi:UDP-GlcNAc:undecaprenyl-phosphate GlcNAc-1-phosphate transferase
MELFNPLAGQSVFWQGALVALSFGLAALLAHSFTPLAIRIAVDYNLVDRPDGKLKNQEAPVPYLGGMSIYLAFLLTLAMTYTFNQQVLAILLAGTIVVLLGLVDDIGALSPKAKFLGQSLAILVLMKAGILIEIIYLPWYVTYPLTYIWLLGITNAFNIIDIMDGLSAGVGLIGVLALLAVAVVNGNMQIAVLTATLAGSLLGFLRFNFVPARIYLGDTGSLFIGLNLGALAMIGSYTEHNPVAVVVPVIILGVPIFDTLFVMYIRRRRGISMFLGSPDHFALRLRAWALTRKRTVLLSYAAAALLAAAGGAVMQLERTGALVVLLALGCCSLAAAVWLKRINMGL